MTIALYLVTHDGIASSFVQTARAILQAPVENLAYTEVPMDASVEGCIQQAGTALEALNKENGLIIITDIYGGTPGNIAQTLAQRFDANLVSGLNLPMLLRLLNYRNETLQALTEKAIDGGRHGIQQH